MTLIARDSNGATIPAIRPGTVQKVSYTATHGEANAVGATTTIVRLVATSACHYTVSAAGTAATTNDTYLPAGVVEYVSVQPGKDIVSFVRDSADGTGYVTEGS